MSKKGKKFYAIKEGKGVENVIVDTWDECSELVLGYHSTYKSFKTLDEANAYLNIEDVTKVEEKIEEPIKPIRGVSPTFPTKPTLRHKLDINVIFVHYKTILSIIKYRKR